MPAAQPGQTSAASLHTTSIEVGGRTFSLQFPGPNDHIAQNIRHTGAFYEAEMLADARSRLFFPKWAVDVGAHVGNHTVFFAGVLGLATLAFEPNPSNFALLRANVDANGLGSLCTFHNVALGAAAGRGRAMDGADGNSGMARVELAETGDVPVVTLDEALVDASGLDIIKIDVEKAELQVLKGAEATFRRFRPIAYVEVDPTNFDSVMAFFLRRNYVCWKQFNATPTFLFLPSERFGP